MGPSTEQLTSRQQRELAYHRERAREREAILSEPFAWGILDKPQRRWWNAYWQTYRHLLALSPAGKSILVIGCGFGHDAIRLAKMGAHVSGFDLSAESVDIAKKLAAREGAVIDVTAMPAEAMRYPDDSFDGIVAVDILHHVDIQKTMQEVRRVAKPGAWFVMDEIYSHSWTDVVRRSWLVEKILYRLMKPLIYGPGKPYITEDERKLTEKDHAVIKQAFSPQVEEFFNFLVGRLLPDWDVAAKADRALLKLLGPAGYLLAGRVIAVGPILK